MSDRLLDKCALVTAAAQGIGRVIALTFAKEGARVIATDVNASKLSELSHEEGIATHVLDVTDLAAVQRAAEKYHGVNVLVNCAGWVPNGTVLDCTEQDMERVYALNVRSMYYTIQAFLPGMLGQSKGSIINIASVVSSVIAAPNRFAYGTSKAAVIGLTKSVAIDFIARGIRCNAISPGTVETESLQARIAQADDVEAARQAFIARQPMGRLARPEEVAAVAVLLASDEAGFLTGENIIIDGGFSL